MPRMWQAKTAEFLSSMARRSPCRSPRPASDRATWVDQVVELRPRNRRLAAAGGGEDDGGYLGCLLGYLMEPRPEGEFSFHAGSSSSGTGVRGMASRF